MNRNLDERLPEASDRFAQAILAGGERVKRYQRRRARLKRLSLAAAVLGLIAIGVASLARLNVPKPDNTVLPINPNSVVAAGLEPEQAQAEVVAGPEPEEAAAEAEQAQTGPEPEEAPAAPMVEAALKTEEEGWTLTLNVAFHQDGPFEAGEWAVICGESGKIDNGGRVVGFYERPDAASRHAETVQGMRAQYLSEAGNGFARVRFEGMEGYIERKHLAHGGAAPEMDPSKHWEVFYAELSITDGQGVVREHSIYRNHDRLQCYALARLLEELEPVDSAEYDGAPFGAALRVTLWDENAPEYNADGTLKMMERFFSVPTDRTAALMAEDGALWAGREDTSILLRSIFPQAWGESGE